MPKKAQEFLVDSALGEQKFNVESPQPTEGNITLAIEEGAVPTTLLTESKGAAGIAKRSKNILVRLDEALRSFGKPNAKDKAAFFRLLAIMINAGIPLIKSLDTIMDQTMNKKLKNAIFEVARSIEDGGTLSDSMAMYPGIFSESQLGMIRAGEASGQLNQALKQLAVEVEKSASISRKVKGALMYPAFIVVVMIGVIAGLMIFVVPKISDIFMQSGQALPMLTRIVVGTSRFMTQKWPILFGVIVGFVLAAIGVRRTQQGKYATDWLVLRTPLFGKIVQKSILARFSRSLSNLLSSGVPIIQGLVLNAKGLGNEVYKQRIMLASEDIARGIPLAESLRDTPEFPGMITQMIGVGEETAQLDTIASKVAEYYEEEVDTAIAGLSKIIEPAIIVIVGGVVGTIVAAVMLPMMQLTQMSGSM